MFLSKLCCEFDSSKVNFTRPEVGRGCIHIELVWKGPESHDQRSESPVAFGHFDSLVGTEVQGLYRKDSDVSVHVRAV